MNALQTATDAPFARFLAASSRELKRDPSLTAMGAFDTLQRIHRKYRARWLSLWIVCADGHADVQPHTPLQTALEQIEEHGGAVGIIGLAVLNRTFTFLKKPLRPGPEIVDFLDVCGNNAADRFLAVAEEVVRQKHIGQPEVKEPSDL